jgi:hypothetical protein
MAKEERDPVGDLQSDGAITERRLTKRTDILILISRTLQLRSVPPSMCVWRSVWSHMINGSEGPDYRSRFAGVTAWPAK